jgi:hypothetical protein
MDDITYKYAYIAGNKRIVIDDIDDNNPTVDYQKTKEYETSKDNDYIQGYALFINECIKENLYVRNCRLCKYHHRIEKIASVYRLSCNKRRIDCREDEAVSCEHYEKTINIYTA